MHIAAHLRVESPADLAVFGSAVPASVSLFNVVNLNAMSIVHVLWTAYLIYLLVDSLRHGLDVGRARVVNLTSIEHHRVGSVLSTLDFGDLSPIEVGQLFGTGHLQLSV